jgi:uncharacterized membrane protein YeaQ/YmgE (transglycosylase-associated protein family)
MINIIMWIVYGIIVGVISKALYGGDSSPKGFLFTILVGIVGSFVGGFLNYALGFGTAFQPSGILMGIVGGVLTCYIYSKLKQ